MNSSNESLVAFFIRSQTRLTNYFTNKTGSIDDAEDLTQEAWIKLSRNEMCTMACPDGYLGAIARTLSIDYFRTSKRKLSQAQIDEILELSDDQPNAEQQLIEKESLSLLAGIIKTLPARQREAILRSRVEGQKYTEIARALGVTVRTVEMDIRQAHDYCRAKLERLNLK